MERREVRWKGLKMEKGLTVDQLWGLEGSLDSKETVMRVSEGEMGEPGSVGERVC
jgi:hypothetical protein